MSARPDCDADAPLSLNIELPRWVAGESKELNWQRHCARQDVVSALHGRAGALRVHWYGAAARHDASHSGMHCC